MHRPPRRLSLPFAAAFAAALLMGGGLSGCTAAGVAVGAGAVTGIAAYQERGVEGAARDLRLSAEIVDEWMRVDHAIITQISVEVYEGRALLTGSVKDDAVRGRAVTLAWKTGVTDVINEIQVNLDSDIVDAARDSWITAQIKTRITFDKNIAAINYSVETVNGIVYLIGIAQNTDELNRVIAYADSTEYVKSVISHVRVKDAGAVGASS